MTTSTSKIQQDFDRIADLHGDGWNHNNAYDDFLLRQLPASSNLDALEVGCGTGGFSRLLASRFRRVLGLDLSPRMIAVARERSGDFSNIDFRVVDFVKEEFAPGSFGCIASIATLHHLPMGETLSKMKLALAPGGTLLILDLYKAESLADYAAALAAVPVNLCLKLIKTGRLTEPPAARAAWREHGRSDVYPILAQVRRACAEVLPGARVTRHLLWRYSIIWKKGPAD